MHHRSNNFGFAVIELVLVLVAVALIGVVGYKVYNTQKSVDKSTNNTEAVLEQTPTASSGVSTINTAADLDEVQSSLDELDAGDDDNNDLSQLDSELATF